MGFFDKVVGAGTFGIAGDDPYGGAFTSLIPGIGDAQAVDKQNKLNLANRDWSERMSNSAYQRAMDDMKKAGLNPMLAYQQGGASVPSAPDMQAASKTRLADAALGAFTGISSARTQQQQANTAATQAQSSVNLQAAQSAKELAQTQNIQADTALKSRELRGKGIKETLDREGGRVVQKIIDNLTTTTAKPPVIREPVIKVLGPADRKKFGGPLIKNNKG